jgi:hypothetical protein
MSTTPQPQAQPPEAKPQPSTPVPTSVTSIEPSVTTPKVDGAALAEAKQAMFNAYMALKKIEGTAPPPPPPEPEPEAPKSEAELRREAIQKTLRDSDVVLDFDIRVLDRNGEIFQISGMETLNYFTEQTQVPESRRNFEAVMYAQIIRPLLNRIQEFLNRFVENQNPIPALPMFGRNHVTPSLPTSGPQAFITDAGR